jgi:adenylate cyclase
MKNDSSASGRLSEILHMEADKTEILIARVRFFVMVVFIAFDSSVWAIGPERAGFPVPPRVLAWDATYTAVSLASWMILRRLRRQPPWAKLLMITMDYIFVAVYTLAYAGYGFSGDMLVGMLTLIAFLLLFASGVRFSLIATGYSGVAALFVMIGVGLSVSASSAMIWSCVLCAAVAAVTAFHISRRHLAAVRNIVERSRFERFLPRQVIDQIIRNDRPVELGGEEVEVTVLFTDIRDFTSLCEGMRPLEVLELLNDYYTAMAAVIFKHMGTLDKYIGDAVMAIFGAPMNERDDADRALLCAREMREVVRNINREREQRGLRLIHFGIGMHTGVVVAGTVGAPERMEYTVIGDAVNVAARVEGLTRTLDADILLTAATRYATTKSHPFIPKGTSRVKGREEALEIFALGD